MVGLAVALSVCFLIALFIRHELSFDASHPDSDRLYRLNWVNTGAGAHFATFFNPVAPLLAEGLPEIETFTRLAINQHLVSVNNQKQYQNISFVDNDFFNIFDMPAISGSTSTIEDRASAVVTEAVALIWHRRRHWRNLYSRRTIRFQSERDHKKQSLKQPSCLEYFRQY